MHAADCYSRALQCVQKGHTALWIAALNANVPCVELLLCKGAKSALVHKVGPPAFAAHAVTNHICSWLAAGHY